MQRANKRDLGKIQRKFTWKISQNGFGLSVWNMVMFYPFGFMFIIAKSKSKSKNKEQVERTQICFPDVVPSAFRHSLSELISEGIFGGHLGTESMTFCGVHDGAECRR